MSYFGTYHYRNGSLSKYNVILVHMLLKTSTGVDCYE
jgi:hypothetical protein